MKIAVAGKGGVGKTSLSAWLGDYLARQGRDVWLVDADTALSLGEALGLPGAQAPRPLIEDDELVRERVGAGGFINLSPRVEDLPERLAVPVAGMRLLVMGTVAGAGGGCACAANALLKALLAHLILEREQWLIVDLEAGVEHLGRGVIAGVDGLAVVAQPGARSLRVAAGVGAMAAQLGLRRQALFLNSCEQAPDLPDMAGLPKLAAHLRPLPSLLSRQLEDGCVLHLDERDEIDAACEKIVRAFEGGRASPYEIRNQ